MRSTLPPPERLPHHLSTEAQRGGPGTGRGVVGLGVSSRPRMPTPATLRSHCGSRLAGLSGRPLRHPPHRLTGRHLTALRLAGIPRARGSTDATLDRSPGSLCHLHSHALARTASTASTASPASPASPAYAHRAYGDSSSLR